MNPIDATIQSDLRMQVTMLEHSRDQQRAQLGSLLTHMRREIERVEQRLHDPTQPVTQVFIGSRADDVGRLSEAIYRIEDQIKTLNQILARDAVRV